MLGPYLMEGIYKSKITPQTFIGNSQEGKYLWDYPLNIYLQLTGEQIIVKLPP